MSEDVDDKPGRRLILSSNSAITFGFLATVIALSVGGFTTYLNLRDEIRDTRKLTTDQAQELKNELQALRFDVQMRTAVPYVSRAEMQLWIEQTARKNTAWNPAELRQ